MRKPTAGDVIKLSKLLGGVLEKLDLTELRAESKDKKSAEKIGMRLISTLLVEHNAELVELIASLNEMSVVDLEALPLDKFEELLAELTSAGGDFSGFFVRVFKRATSASGNGAGQLQK